MLKINKDFKPVTNDQIIEDFFKYWTEKISYASNEIANKKSSANYIVVGSKIAKILEDYVEN